MAHSFFEQLCEHLNEGVLICDSEGQVLHGDLPPLNVPSHEGDLDVVVEDGWGGAQQMDGARRAYAPSASNKHKTPPSQR